MKNLKSAVKKNVCNAAAAALNKAAGEISSQCCYFVYHQPKEPENLKAFSNLKGHE